MRDAMRNGQYLLIDGEQVPVILDDGIVEEDEGDATSFFAFLANEIPAMSAVGGRPGALDLVVGHGCPAH